MAFLVKENLNLDNKVSIVNTEKSKESHWIVYKQDPTPQYIIEAKKRLGQIRQPNVSPKDIKYEKLSSPSPSIESFYTSKESENINQLKHWSNFDSPSTPENIRLIRKRLGDDRYKKMNLINKSRSNSDLKNINNEVVKNDLKDLYIPKYLNNKKTDININADNNKLQIDDKLVYEIENEIEISKSFNEKKRHLEERNSRLSNYSNFSENSISKISVQSNTVNGIPFDEWMGKANNKGILMIYF